MDTVIFHCMKCMCNHYFHRTISMKYVFFLIIATKKKCPRLEGQSNDDMEIVVALSDARQTSLSDITLLPKVILAGKILNTQCQTIPDMPDCTTGNFNAKSYCHLGKYKISDP